MTQNPSIEDEKKVALLEGTPDGVVMGGAGKWAKKTPRCKKVRIGKLFDFY